MAGFFFRSIKEFWSLKQYNVKRIYTQLWFFVKDGFPRTLGTSSEVMFSDFDDTWDKITIS